MLTHKAGQNYKKQREDEEEEEESSHIGVEKWLKTGGRTFLHILHEADFGRYKNFCFY